jgi:hypothetical protein
VADVGEPGSPDARVDYLAFEPNRELPVDLKMASHSQGGTA